MKQIFTLLFILLAAIKIQAQPVIDIQPFTIIDPGESSLLDTGDFTNNNTVLMIEEVDGPFEKRCVLQNGDSVHAIIGFYNHGPSPIDSSLHLTALSSFNQFLTEAECIYYNLPYYAHPDSPHYYWVTQYTPPYPVLNDTILVTSDWSADSIGLLGDWAEWINNGRIKLLGKPFHQFVNYQTYAFFVKVLSVTATGSTVNYESDTTNNIYVQKINYLAQSVSVKDLVVKRHKEALNIYPNPSDQMLHFSYDFKQQSFGQLLIKDLSGRMVFFKQFGPQNAGKKEFEVNLSTLPAGTYLITFETGETEAHAKLIKK